MIELFNVTVTIGNRKILDNFSLRIQKGEFVYVIGKTGSGKTTLLRTIYMDQLPSSGNILVDKFSSSSIKKREVPLLRRKVGVISSCCRTAMSLKMSPLPCA